jgi:hypothetical protein
MLYNILTFDKSIILKFNRGLNSKDQIVHKIFIYIVEVTVEGFFGLFFFGGSSRLYFRGKK